MAKSKLEKEEEKAQSELKEVKKELEELHLEMKSLGNQMNDKKSVAGNLRKKLKDAEKAKKIHITDHALLRYIERILGIDVEQIRNEILTEETRYQVFVLGDGKYPVNNDHYVIIRDNALITVYPINDAE